MNTALGTFAARALAVVALANLPVWADLTLTCRQAVVRSGATCHLAVAGAEPGGAAWVWTVLEADGGTVVPGEPGQARYTAPKVRQPRSFRVQVWQDAHPERVAVREIRVLPEAPAGPVPAAKPHPWMVPKLELYAGDPEPAADRHTLVFSSINKVCWLEDPALPPALDRHWVVADDLGLQLVSVRGEVTPWLGGKDRPGPGRRSSAAPADAFICKGLAVRPEASPEGNPLHLVFSAAMPPQFASRIYALDADGNRRVLAGGQGPGCKDGPAGEALFGDIGDLAMDREGNVFVLDRGNHMVREVTVDGQVLTLAGHRPAGAPEFQDGPGVQAAFLDPRGLVWDPATGDLYVSDGDAIRRVSLAGEVTTVLGAPGAGPASAGFEPAGSDPQGRPEPGKPCLQHPQGLTLQGRELFIADNFNCAVRVYGLTSGRLRTLVGNPAEPRTRRGPLGYFHPDRPAADCASLAACHSVAFDREGACLVATGDCLVNLDMPSLDGLPPVRPDASGEPAGPAKDLTDGQAPLVAPVQEAAAREAPAKVLPPAEAPARIPPPAEPPVRQLPAAEPPARAIPVPEVPTRAAPGPEPPAPPVPAAATPAREVPAKAAPVPPTPLA